MERVYAKTNDSYFVKRKLSEGNGGAVIRLEQQELPSQLKKAIGIEIGKQPNKPLEDMKSPLMFRSKEPQGQASQSTLESRNLNSNQNSDGSSPILEFNTKPLKVNTNSQTAMFKPKVRRASQDLTGEGSAKMFTSDIYQPSIDKPVEVSGWLQSKARKVVVEQVESPLKRFKEAKMMSCFDTPLDLSKKSLVGMDRMEKKENTTSKPFFEEDMKLKIAAKLESKIELNRTDHDKKPQEEVPSPRKIDMLKKPMMPLEPRLVTDNTIKPLEFRKYDSKQNGSQSGSPSKLKKKKTTKDDFIVQKKLGSGRFGDVFLVEHKELGFVCAMKIISKAMVKEEKLECQIISELKIQSHLSHPNLVALYGYFDDPANLYILLELCPDGHLQRKIQKVKTLPEVQAKDIIHQVCSGVEYLHRHKILHRDIKPENILMSSVSLGVMQGIAKLADFGWAAYTKDGLRQTFCGTPLYVSPQILKGQLYDDKIDTWSLGVLSYELLIGKSPFKINSQQDLNKIITDNIRFPEYVPLSAESKQFLTKALSKDPSQRMDIDDMLHHRFLTENLKTQTTIDSY